MFPPLWIIWSIIAVELTLKWNGATGIYDVKSTGQLIPLITGVLSLIGLLQVHITNYLRESYVSLRFETRRMLADSVVVPMAVRRI